MAYVPVPKDLNAVKTKVMLNLTKRQLLCFGAGAAIGVPLFFLLKGSMGTSPAVICMIIQVYFLRPKQRPYETNNFYVLLKRQDDLDKEVYRIVNGKKAFKSRPKADRGGNRKGEQDGQKA